jgi:hypothetical protein
LSANRVIDHHLLEGIWLLSLLTRADDAPAHRCVKCGKAFTRSDLLKRHEAGHERWEKKDQTGANLSGKRKRVAFEATSPTEGQTSSHSTWTVEDQEAALALVSSPRPIRSKNDGLSDTHSNYRPLTTTLSINQQPPNMGYPGINDNQLSVLQSPYAYDYSYSGFDFSTFLIPPDSNQLGVGHEWFSTDFYSAMHETGDYGIQNQIFDPNLMPLMQDDTFYGEEQRPLGQVPSQIDEPIRDEAGDDDFSEDSSVESHRPRSGRISRMSSPPNEACEEDKTPFKWNPRSVPFLTAKPIVVPDGHPLFQNHDPRFDITEMTLLKIKSFLQPPTGPEFHQSQRGSFVLPTLPVINIFIRLFFQHFSPQVPVLHHATVNTNTDLPAPLLAVMIVIGSIYSHLNHSRRFSIVLLDTVRWHLQIALESDNGLMREPMIIFAEALVCHAGLWCGNKRSFELGEVVRGAVVTYMRRLHFHDLGSAPISTQSPSEVDINAQWRQWIKEESDRRLFWVVYAIDCQFSSLLNLPSTIAIGEVGQSGCPCDEEFWCAVSARHWKNLLGPASIPPSRSFHVAVGPFVLSNYGVPAEKPRDEFPKLDLNSWSAFLVLLTIQNQIFQFTQESILARNFMPDNEAPEAAESINYLFQIRQERRQQFAGMFNNIVLLQLNISCICFVNIKEIHSPPGPNATPPLRPAQARTLHPNTSTLPQ